MLAELIIDSELCGVRGAEQSARMRRSEVNSAQEIGIWKQHISALPPVNTLTDATRQQRDRNRPQIPRKRRRVLKLWPWGWNLEILQTFLIQLLNEPISVWAGCVLVWMLQGLVTTFYMLYRCGIQNLGSEVLFFFFLLAPLKSTRGRHRPRLISMKLNQTELLLQPAATIQRSTLIAPPNFTLNWTNCWFFLSLCGVFNRKLEWEGFFISFFFLLQTTPQICSRLLTLVSRMRQYDECQRSRWSILQVKSAQLSACWARCLAPRKESCCSTNPDHLVRRAAWS